MDFRCVTFSWRGTVYCARERTDRTKKKGEKITESSFKCCGKENEIFVVFSSREKEKKKIKREYREREGKGERNQREEIPEGWKWFQSSSATTAFSFYVSISEVARPPLFRREPQRAVFIQCNSLCQHCTSV